MTPETVHLFDRFLTPAYSQFWDSRLTVGRTLWPVRTAFDSDPSAVIRTYPPHVGLYTPAAKDLLLDVWEDGSGLVHGDPRQQAVAWDVDDGAAIRGHRRRCLRPWPPFRNGRTVATRSLSDANTPCGSFIRGRGARVATRDSSEDLW